MLSWFDFMVGAVFWGWLTVVWAAILYLLVGVLLCFGLVDACCFDWCGCLFVYGCLIVVVWLDLLAV